MTGIFILLSIPIALTTAAIFVKFILLCREAREKEFLARQRATIAQTESK